MRLRTFATLFAAALPALALATPACAQSDVLLQPDTNAHVSVLHDQPAPSLRPLQLAEVTAPEPHLEIQQADSIASGLPMGNGDTGFWYLSTHSSPQTFDQRPCFRPGVCRYEDGAGFHRSHFQNLKTQLQPGIPICIVVHGSFMDVPSTWSESVCTWRWLKSASMGQPMQMIYLTWPSYRTIGPAVQIQVNQLGRRAARNGYYLAELLQHLPPESPVCLVGHSHGTRVVSASLHYLAGGTVQSMKHPWARSNGRRIRAVFAASAIDHDWLLPGHKYDRALCTTECVLNLYNRHDPALGIYPLRFPLVAKRALGAQGLTRRDRVLLGPRSRQVVDYNATDAIGTTHLWPYYYRNPGLAMAMHNYVYFPDHVPASLAAE